LSTGDLPVFKCLSITTNGQKLQSLLDDPQIQKHKHSVEMQNSVNALPPGDSS